MNTVKPPKSTKKVDVVRKKVDPYTRVWWVLWFGVPLTIFGLSAPLWAQVDLSTSTFLGWSTQDFLDYSIPTSFAIGAGLVVTALVTVVIEPVSAAAVAKQVANSTALAMFRANAPGEYLEFMEILARRAYFTVWSKWTVTLNYVDNQSDYLQVDVQVSANAKVLADKGYRPSSSFRCIPSIAGETSRILSWKVTGDHVKDVEVRSNADGTVPEKFRLDGDEFVATITHSISEGQSFHIAKHGRFFLPTHGMMPMFSQDPDMETEVVVDGPAAAGLRFLLVGSSNRSAFTEGEAVGECKFDRTMTFPGQGMVLCWYPGT